MSTLNFGPFDNCSVRSVQGWFPGEGMSGAHQRVLVHFFWRCNKFPKNGRRETSNALCICWSRLGKCESFSTNTGRWHCLWKCGSLLPPNCQLALPAHTEVVIPVESWTSKEWLCGTDLHTAHRQWAICEPVFSLPWSPVLDGREGGAESRHHVLCLVIDKSAVAYGFYCEARELKLCLDYGVSQNCNANVF